MVLDRMLARPPVRAIPRWSALPHVMPFFAQDGPQFAHVLVVADRTGADLSTVGLDDALAAAPGQKLTVTGSEQNPIHKVGRDRWNVAGEERARALLRHSLPEVLASTSKR